MKTGGCIGPDDSRLGEGVAMPKVSVITVVRNDRTGLAKTIASVKAQLYPNLEFIVIDGASTDGTVELIRQNQDGIDYWVSEPDAGLYDAMNKGKAAASGSLALFVNAGDTFVTSDALVRLLSPLPSPNIVLCGNVRVSHGSKRWQMPPRAGDQPFLPAGYVPHHQTVLYPRAHFETEHYDLTFRVMGDVDFTCRAIRRFPMEYRDVDLVESVMGGFTFTRYRSLRGALEMNRERQALYRKYTIDYSRLQSASLAGMIFAKYISVRLFGVAGTSRLMQWKTRLAFTKSLGHVRWKRD